jgi:uncharacterized membrane protein
MCYNSNLKISTIKFWLLCPVIFLLFSCTQEVIILDDLDEVCFEQQVLPVIQTSCGISGCHDAAGEAEDFIAYDYENIMRIVKESDARNSKLYQIITAINSPEMMPPDRALSKEQRTLIQVWIEQGAKNNSCPDNPVDTGNNTTIIPPISNPDTICFTQHVLPVLQSSCATTGCHDAASHKEGYNFTSYETLMQKSESIIPFDPGESKVYKVITENESDDRMPPPPSTPLSTDQIEVIREWILQGAVNSDCPNLDCDTLTAISYSSQVWPVIQTNCTGCHNSVTPSGGIKLTNYTDVASITNMINGTPLIVGNIRRISGFKAMPPSNSLDKCTIRTIELWIEQGAANN